MIHFLDAHINEHVCMCSTQSKTQIKRKGPIFVKTANSNSKSQNLPFIRIDVGCSKFYCRISGYDHDIEDNDTQCRGNAAACSLPMLH